VSNLSSFDWSKTLIGGAVVSEEEHGGVPGGVVESLN